MRIDKDAMKYNMKKEITFKGVFTTAGAVLAAMIGASYAGGQENLQYASGYGYIGFGSGIIIAVVSIIIYGLMGRLGFESKKDPRLSTFNYYMGKYLGWLFTVLVPVFCAVICIAMCSAGGEIVDTYFNMPHWSGVVIMVVITAITVAFDFKKIISALGILGPVIIVGLIVLCIYGCATGTDFADADEFCRKTDMLLISDSWVSAGLQYAVLGICFLVPFFMEVYSNTISKKEAMWGGIVGDGMIGIIFALETAAILCNIKSVYQEPLPMLWLAMKMNPVIGVLFIIIIYIAIYTTAVSLFWTAVEKIPTKATWNKYAIIIGMSVAILVVGQFPYDKLVNILYPVMGYASILICIMIVVRAIQDWKKDKASH